MNSNYLLVIDAFTRLSAFAPIRNYFEKTREYPPLRFILEMTALTFPLKVLFSLPLLAFGGNLRGTTEAVDIGGPILLVFMGCIVAPLVETFIGQWLPIDILRKRTHMWTILILGSAVFSALIHLYAGFGGFLTTLPVAAVLSWSFLVYDQRDRTQAFGVTAAIHCLHNVITIGAYLLTSLEPNL